MAKNFVFVGAHPDDCEIKAGGLACLLREAGHKVAFVSLTDGCKGSYIHGPKELAEIRKTEAKKATEGRGIEAVCLGVADGELMPTLENRVKLVNELRRLKADFVISHRPNDYHPDHRYTGVLVQDVAYMLGVPGVCPESFVDGVDPVFLYFSDDFKKPNPFSPDVVIGIERVLDDKLSLMLAHESQFFEFLPQIMKADLETENGRPTVDEVKKWICQVWLEKPNDKKKEILKLRGLESQEFCESFEFSEYGKVVSQQEIQDLFYKL